MNTETINTIPQEVGAIELPEINDKIDWKRKLTSRKFWCAVVGFITPILTAIGMDADGIALVTSIVMSGAVLIAYIIGEGLADAAHAGVANAIPGVVVEDTVDNGVLGQTIAAGITAGITAGMGEASRIGGENRNG